MLLTQPSIVGTVGDQRTYEQLSHLDSVSACDFLEFRIDALQRPEEIPLVLPTEIPSIITIRHPAEGGQGNWSDIQRHVAFETYLPFASLIDVEIRSLADFAPLVENAKAGEILVIGSFHDFETTPSREFLLEQIELGIERGADVIKLATTVTSSAEITRLAEILDEEGTRVQLSAMGMGKLGKISRLLLAQHGSLLNYAYLMNANASGQWFAPKLRSLFEELDV